MSLQFYLSSTKTGTGTVYCRFQRYGVRIHRSTGLKLPEKYWNEKRGLPDARTKESLELQERLMAGEKILEDFLLVKRSREEILAAFDRAFEPERISMILIYQNFLQEILERKGRDSFKKYRTILGNLETFSRDTGIPLEFDRIDETFGEDLRHWYQVNDYSPNTAGRAMGFIKTFMRWAQKRGHHNSVKWTDLKKQTFDKEITFLSLEELLELSQADLPTRLSQVRDLFCIGCFTGLRYSDLKRISQDHIGDDFLILRTQKDDDHLRIPLSGHARRILDKYISAGKEIPSISNQKGNKYLKELARATGLNRRILVTGWESGRRRETFKPLHELISWHMARRTFITLSLEGGMEPSVIIKITGHSDIKSLRPYMALTDKLVKDQMDKVWGSGSLRAI